MWGKRARWEIRDWGTQKKANSRPPKQLRLILFLATTTTKKILCCFASLLANLNSGGRIRKTWAPSALKINLCSNPSPGLWLILILSELLASWQYLLYPWQVKQSIYHKCCCCWNLKVLAGNMSSPSHVGVRTVVCVSTISFSKTSKMFLKKWVLLQLNTAYCWEKVFTWCWWITETSCLFCSLGQRTK